MGFDLWVICMVYDLSDILYGYFDNKNGGNTLPGVRVSCQRPVGRGWLPPEKIYAILKKLLLVWSRNLLRHESQIRLQLSAASPTNRPQPKVIITKVIIKLKLWLAAGCEAKVAAELSSHP